MSFLFSFRGSSVSFRGTDSPTTRPRTIAAPGREGTEKDPVPSSPDRAPTPTATRPARPFSPPSSRTPVPPSPSRAAPTRIALARRPARRALRVRSVLPWRGRGERRDAWPPLLGGAVARAMASRFLSTPSSSFLSVPSLPRGALPLNERSFCSGPERCVSTREPACARSAAAARCRLARRACGATRTRHAAAAARCCRLARTKQTGFWADHLGAAGLHYHISALFVVDLAAFLPRADALREASSTRCFYTCLSSGVWGRGGRISACRVGGGRSHQRMSRLEP